MRSMTGYGRSSSGIGHRTVTVQVSSVNRKTLDLTIKLPSAWEALEAPISERVRRSASRGKVHVDMEVSGGDDSGHVAWDSAAVGVILDRLAILAAERGVVFSPTSELLWSIANSQRRPEAVPPLEEVREALLAALDLALEGFVLMRAREGEALLVDFLRRLELLQVQVTLIAGRAPQVVANYREQLLMRLRQAGLELELNDERVWREIALFADRCDLSEELTRFRSHLDQLESLLKSGGEMGRKAEFILQEMGREVNTMGSKANDFTIARAVIELKNELERVREQIANVE